MKNEIKYDQKMKTKDDGWWLMKIMNVLRTDSETWKQV